MQQASLRFGAECPPPNLTLALAPRLPLSALGWSCAVALHVSPWDREPLSWMTQLCFSWTPGCPELKPQLPTPQQPKKGHILYQVGIQGA